MHKIWGGGVFERSAGTAVRERETTQQQKRDRRKDEEGETKIKNKKNIRQGERHVRLGAAERVRGARI